MDAQTTSDTLPTQPSLIRRLGNFDDQAAWQEFVGRYRLPLERLASSGGLRDWEREDLVQEVFKSVVKTISSFKVNSQNGSFRRWLFNLARWRLKDILKQRFRRENRFVQSKADDEVGKTPLIERVPEKTQPEVGRLESDREVIEELLKRVRASVSARDMQIFQSLVFDEVEPDLLAKLYNIEKGNLYTAKSRVMSKLRSSVSALCEK